IYNRVIARLGMRNFFRHKGHSIISIAGLLVGTSIICASMVVGDSIEYFIVEETYDSLELIDIVIEGENRMPFDESIYTMLDSDTQLAGLTDGMAPLYSQTVSTRHTGTGLFEPTVNIVGFDAAEDLDFGTFTKMDGSSIQGNDLGANDTIMNWALAENLGAEEGDTLMLTYTLGSTYMGYGDIQSRTVTIRHIADDVGKTRYNPGIGMGMDTYNLFVNLDTAQEMFQQQGMLTHIKVSAIGGVEDVENSEEVMAAIEPLITDLSFTADEIPVPYAMPNQTFAVLDNSNIISGTLELEHNGTLLPDTMYEINEAAGTIIFFSPLQMGDVVTADYDYTYIIEVDAVKQDSLEMARDINDMLSTFLTIFGSFAIIAGVILIINIFTMLAEERKSELGMARAVGMKRRHLMQSFLFEGLTYGSVASALGTLFGVILGAFLIYMINNIATILADIVIPFHFETFSLITAFSMGFAITFGTILLTSWKISKLNIIRAIRGIDEPPSDRKSWKLPILGVLMVVASTIMIWQQWDNEFMVKLLAPSGLITGLCMILWRWVGDRISVSGASLSVFLYTYYAIKTYFGDAGDESMEMPFILSGVLIVLSLVLLVMYNSRPVIMGIVKVFGSMKKFRPTVMVAVSYPLSKKFRTGMSVAMFALVVYMIVMLSVFSNMFVMDLDEETLKQGGGYDILAQVQNPVMDINNASYFDQSTMSMVSITSDALDYADISQVAQTYSPDMNNTDAPEDSGAHMGFGFGLMSSGTPVYGIDSDFYEGRQFEFTLMMDNFASEEEVWDAIMEPGSDYMVLNSMMTMITGIEIGDHVTFTTLSGNVTDEYQLAGIVDQSALNGAFISRENVLMDFGHEGMVNFLFMVDVHEGHDIEEVANLLEKDFADLGLNTMIFRDMAEASMEMINSMFVLFELYLYMGLVVGVAGLGIITIRSVVERTPEIGILRSIGFKRKNIRNAFLIEILFIATMGVVMGTLAGIMVSYEIFNVMVSGMGGNIEYVIPWGKIALVTLIAYIATILCTILPAQNASKTSPAESLRYVG
ncbi:MAG: FtsX-like permease family protein, partial [Thermoplasmata archaeon]|nr:FtsX-like permease family protein [Thermoplasmata archaeon]